MDPTGWGALVHALNTPRYMMTTADRFVIAVWEMGGYIALVVLLIIYVIRQVWRHEAAEAPSTERTVLSGCYEDAINRESKL